MNTQQATTSRELADLMAVYDEQHDTSYTMDEMLWALETEADRAYSEWQNMAELVEVFDNV